MNAREQRRAVNHLAKKSLRELRKRQDLLSAQIELAYSQRNDRALANLQTMQRLTDAAVDRVAFGDGGSHERAWRGVRMQADGHIPLRERLAAQLLRAAGMRLNDGWQLR
jgi:hypothetical protein